MKRVLTLLAILVAVAVAVASAGAATSPAKQIKALRKQSKTLQAQVKTLQKQVKTLQSQMKIVGIDISYSFAATTCAVAMTADMFQSTWLTLDNVPITGTPFSALTTPPVDDFSACSDLQVARVTGQSLPSLTAFNSLLASLYAPS